MVNTLVREYSSVERDLSDKECVRLYEKDPNVAIAKTYKRYAAMLYSLGRKYYSLSREDIESISFETINKALLNFSKTGGGNFATYLTHLMRNALKNELRALTIESVTRNWYVDVQFETDTSDEDGVVSPFDTRGETEEQYSNIEILESVKTTTVTQNQYNYVQAIITSGKDLSDSEVAKMIGVSRSSIKGIKEGLKNKLVNVF